ncbi:glycosyltransferase family 4 protein [Pseudarthrobacter sp. NIBRBAC000502772]|uniref:glycosyltransferase family 4 protein n=1 Tax=Pseudarthrobacter sp. NIBRBAC000502772 TaxID=2590775 RepID=UPI001FF0641F|nr:glycosyltransferase family 4 protein [Pseudarthrobacter sp. NIBRBAC000502772]
MHVITGYPHYPEWRLTAGYRGWSQSEETNGVRVTRLRHHIPRSPNTLSRLHMELSFGVRAVLSQWHSPDVVLVISPALFSSALTIMRVRASVRRPAVGIWVQDIYSLGVVETRQGGAGLGGLMGWIEARVLGSTDGIVAIHDRFRQYMIDTLGIPEHITKVIRNWTHLPHSPAFDRKQMRRKMGWQEHEVVVLHAGNMGKKQGLENVVNAARIAEETDSDVRFVLMGSGNQRRQLESLAQNLGHIEFLNALPGDQFQMALAAADVLLVNELPGVKDMAVPSKLTSYFNSGRPVLAATDEESVTASEVAAAGGGVRVDAADPEALVLKAEELGRNPGLANALGSQGLRFRMETLSEATAIAKYDGFIKTMASSRRRK